MPGLVDKPWFGPKRILGWGWIPITWQGWMVVAVFFAAILAGAYLIPGTIVKVVVELVLVLALLAVCALTGTRPGGRWR
jgi:hypothetical protein